MKRITYIITIVIILGGCKEDWLDTYPLGTETEVSFYSTFEAADMTVTAAYGNLGKDLNYDVTYQIAIGGSPSDDIETGGENIFDWDEAGRGDLFQFDPSHKHIQSFWDYNYRGIRIANTAIIKLNLFVEKASGDQLELINSRIAEMKFLRAFYHFLIAQVFGGGPYITELITPDMFTSTPRMHLAEFYQMIEQDLLEAIPDLKTKTELGPEQIGRASKGAAQALLGKLYLYESSYAANYPGDERFTGMRNLYSEALQQFENVISSPDYQLVGIDSTETYTSWWNSNNSSSPGTWGQVGAYRWIFTVDGDNSPESVWEIQRIQDDLDWMRTRGSYLTVYSTARLIKSMDGTPLPELGWSFNSPSKYLEQAFGNNDSREDGLLSLPEKYNSSLDPRYPVTIGKDGDSILYESGGDDWVLLDMSGGGKNNLPTHKICRKFEASPTEYWSVKINWQEGPVNTRIIRMGDVYLMAAEAALQSGDAAKALEYVNAVRTRARYSGVAGGYPEYTGYPKNLPAVNLNDIIHERRIELGGEGHRYFDLVRWNRTELLSVEVEERKTTCEFVKGKHEFLPVPLTEIQSSEGAIKQNPNY